MTELNDHELLAEYAHSGSEAAFAALVERYVNLVYSAALRFTGNPHHAQEITQAVFVTLAGKAGGLRRSVVVPGWLYQTARLTAANFVKSEIRRQKREQEAYMQSTLNEPEAPPWEQVAPLLDEAMGCLGETDRNAVVLRYFENRTAEETGTLLKLTAAAAHKRVERALEKLRKFFSKRNVTVGMGGLGVLISANAVQSAPTGLATAISAAAISGTAISTATLITATTTIAMTTIQKTIIVAALAAAVGTGIYAVHQGGQLRGQIQSLEDQQAPLTAQIQQLEQGRNRASNQLAALQAENARLKSGSNTTELLKLRGQVGTLRQRAAANEAKSNQPASGLDKMMSDPAMKEFIRQAQKEKIKSMYADLFKELKLAPEQSDRFLELLCDIASKSMERITSPGTSDQSAADAMADLGKQLHALLGDAGTARFKEYSDEIPARTTVSLLNDKLGDSPLSAEQRASLLQAVKAEPADLTMGLTGAPDKAFLGSQADIDSFLQRVTESNQRILQQAGSFLTPDQLAALDTLLTTSIETRKLQAAALIQKH